MSVAGPRFVRVISRSSKHFVLRGRRGMPGVEFHPSLAEGLPERIGSETQLDQGGCLQRSFAAELSFYSWIYRVSEVFSRSKVTVSEDLFEERKQTHQQQSSSSS